MIQHYLVILLMCAAASRAASAEDSAATASTQELHASDHYGGSTNTNSNWMLLELSEQVDLAAQSLKPNAEPTVFRPPTPQSAAAIAGTAVVVAAAGVAATRA